MVDFVEQRPSRELFCWAGCFWLAWVLVAGFPKMGRAQAQPLQLTISVAQSTITEPFPAQTTLHFHNSSNQLLWLYEPVRDVGEIALSLTGANSDSGGSSLAVHLEPAVASGGGAGGAASPAVGTVLQPPGFPHPNLVRLAPGGDLQVTAVIQVKPASGAEGPIWGTYQLSVAYSARYSNGNDIRQSLGVNLWQGTVSSNAVHITLSPVPAANHDSILGSAVGRDMIPDADVLVSLSNDQQQLVAQTVTGADGNFYFDNLPAGRYWVTVRREGGTEDTGFFEHTDLSDAQPATKLKLIMLNEEVYDAKRLLHKPVLFRITNTAGDPMSGVTLEILWSDGTVIDNVKAEVESDGLAVVSLLPGSNYVTIRKHGCPKDDQMADVLSGSGVGGFSFTLNCRKKK